jgi:hypothetical protein
VQSLCGNLSNEEVGMVLKGLAVGGVLAAVLSVVAAFLFLRPVAPSAGLVAEPMTVQAVPMPNGVALPQLQPAQPASAPVLVNDAAPVGLVSAETRFFNAAKADSRAAASESFYAVGMGCGN